MSLYMYKEKYTKYKNKYLELKKQLGGTSYYGPANTSYPLTDIDIIKHLLYVHWRNWLNDHSYNVSGTNPFIITYGNYHLTMYASEIDNMNGHITDNRLDYNHPKKRFNLYYDSTTETANCTRNLFFESDNNNDYDQKLGLFKLFQDIWRKLFRIGYIYEYDEINEY